MKLNFNGKTLEIWSDGKSFTVELDDQVISAEVLHSENARLDLLVDGKRVTAYVSAENAKRWVTVHGQTFVLTKSSNAQSGGRGHHEAAGKLTAPMPGQIRAVNVSAGETVMKGQTLLVIEAMKMEIRVQAPRPGKIVKIHVEQGQTVEREQTLVEIEEGS